MAGAFRVLRRPHDVPTGEPRVQPEHARGPQHPALLGRWTRSDKFERGVGRGANQRRRSVLGMPKKAFGWKQLPVAFDCSNQAVEPPRIHVGLEMKIARQPVADLAT